MEFEELHEKLLDIFYYKEFLKHPIYKNRWSKFIESKDLGIILSDRNYEVVDEKKWLLTRLKYGI